MQLRQQRRQFAVFDQPGARRRGCVQAPLVVQPPLPHGGDGLAGMGLQAGEFVGAAQDQRRRIQAHIHTLRAVLEKPVALRIAFVVAADEGEDLRAGDGLSRGAAPVALRMQVPAAAGVQRQPAVHCRHVGPAGQSVFTS